MFEGVHTSVSFGHLFSIPGRQPHCTKNTRSRPEILIRNTLNNKVSIKKNSSRWTMVRLQDDHRIAVNLVNQFQYLLLDTLNPHS